MYREDELVCVSQFKNLRTKAVRLNIYREVADSRAAGISYGIRHVFVIIQ